MHYVKTDSRGELILTYDVTIDCHGKRFLHLGTGHEAVDRFCDIVKDGIPEAKEIECLWAGNYRVTISGEGLAQFLERCYPEIGYSKDKLDPEEEYVIDCYDMS